MSLSPADMDFAGLKAGAAREIALAFGVPPVMLGLPGDATYSNAREANKALWRQSILPLAGKILDAIAEGLRPWYPGLTLAADLDRVVALSEDRERLWAQVAGVDFLTLDEKRALIGYDVVTKDTPSSGAKFNQNHDPENGQFTFGDGGNRFSRGGGSFGGAGASGSWEVRPARSSNPAKRPRPLPPPKQRRLEPAVTNPNLPAPTAKPLAKPRPTSIQSLRPKSSTRKIEAGGYGFEADAQDRTVRASGQLRLQPDQPRSRSVQRNAGKPNRLPNDHGGHFIAREFGGPEISYNHFAQNARFNSSDYRKLENDWKGSLKAGKKVSVDIRASYPISSKRPDMIRVVYYVSGKRLFQSFPNYK
jgi:hypothetical protein